MARVVILGAGLGGMAAAYEMRAALGSQHTVTVVNERPDYVFIPSNPWITVGWRKRSQTSFPIGPALARKGIEFVCQRAATIDAANNCLTFENGNTLDYDHLLITTGPKLALALLHSGDIAVGKVK